MFVSIGENGCCSKTFLWFCSRLSVKNITQPSGTITQISRTNILQMFCVALDVKCTSVNQSMWGVSVYLNLVMKISLPISSCWKWMYSWNVYPTEFSLVTYQCCWESTPVRHQYCVCPDITSILCLQLLAKLMGKLLI